MNNQITQLAEFDIPADVLELVRVRAVAGAHGKLESLLWFRENYIGELNHGQLMTAYAKYAKAMMISSKTLQRNLWQIRAYQPEDLYRWIEAGVSFEHFEIAASLAEIAKKTPKQLLDECLSLGDEHGNVMTVENLTSHALGAEIKRPETYQAINWLSKLSNIPKVLQWGSEKIQRWDMWIQQGKEFFA